MKGEREDEVELIGNTVFVCVCCLRGRVSLGVTRWCVVSCVCVYFCRT
jgi:hypothetical protein